MITVVNTGMSLSNSDFPLPFSIVCVDSSLYIIWCNVKQYFLVKNVLVELVT